MDAERAPQHQADAVKTKSRGRCVLMSMQSQHVPCEAYCTTRARARKEGFLVVTSKHVVYKLVFPGESISARTSTVQCSAWEFATSIVLLLMAEEFRATLERQGAASIHRARPIQRCFVWSSRHHMQWISLEQTV